MPVLTTLHTPPVWSARSPMACGHHRRWPSSLSLVVDPGLRARTATVSKWIDRHACEAMGVDSQSTSVCSPRLPCSDPAGCGPDMKVTRGEQRGRFEIVLSTRRTGSHLLTRASNVTGP